MSQKTAKRERRAKAAVLKAKDNGAPAPIPQAPQAFKVPGALAQEILNYLQTKPFVEVHQLIGGLMRCEKLKE